jgi:hypothetical protein
VTRKGNRTIERGDRDEQAIRQGARRQAASCQRARSPPLVPDGRIGGCGGCSRAAGEHEAEADESQAERVKARYKETDHVKNYYRVNRY